MKTTSQRGLALVTSLIMLGLITMLAIAFIGLARRERHSVEVTKKTTEAKMMADASLARAQGEVMKRLHDNINLQLFVSANAIPLSSSGPDPRPPVVYTVNTTQTDDRFFLNLNRDFDAAGLPKFQPTTATQAGDPQWIGVLEDPTKSHSADNRFIGRFAYMVAPASKALDLNLIHNGPTYGRATGNSDMELNLAASLGQVDGSVWPYASHLNQNKIFPFNWLFDQQSLAWLDATGLSFYRQTSSGVKDIHDLLTLPPPYSPFSQRLKVATANNPYAFYKLAATLTTTSFPPPTAKFNLNNPNNLPAEEYFREVADRLLQASLVSEVIGNVTNYHVGKVVTGNEIGVSTSTSRFDPASFTSANISLYPTNQYTPEVHRLLQVAANIYDAVAGSSSPTPSVFRPRFAIKNNAVFIDRYIEEANDVFLTNTPIVNLTTAAEVANITPSCRIGMYLPLQGYRAGEALGLPIIVGTKKRFYGANIPPNLNEIASQLVITHTEYGPPKESTYEVLLKLITETYRSSIALNPAINYDAVLATEIRGSGQVKFNGVDSPMLFQSSTPAQTSQVNVGSPVSSVIPTTLLSTPRISGNPSLVLSGFQATIRVTYALCHQGKVLDYANIVFAHAANNLVSTPSKREFNAVTLQVDDPLVNAWANDYLPSSPLSPALNIGPFPQLPSTIGVAPDWGASKPWPRPPVPGNFEKNDVGIYDSGSWNFSSGPLGNIGELGQIHRGTPWQTIYFKAVAPGIAAADKWPDTFTSIYSGGRTPDSHPTNDWRLADLFTVTSAANTSLLSVNQTQDTAWAAALAPVSLGTPPEDRLNAGTHDYKVFSLKPQIVTRQLPPLGDLDVIPHPSISGVYYSFPPAHPRVLYFRQDNILAGKGSYTDVNTGCVNTVLGNQLTHRNPSAFLLVPSSLPNTWKVSPTPINFITLPTPPSDFLLGENLVKTLTVGINTYRTTKLANAPFSSVGQLLGTPELTFNFPSAFTQNWSNDSDYERLPAQLLSLLKVEEEPAVVVYAWGQSLKPADKAVNTDLKQGPIGEVNNYTVTGQVGTRTVLRVKNFNPAIINQPPRMVVESFRVLP